MQRYSAYKNTRHKWHSENNNTRHKLYSAYMKITMQRYSAYNNTQHNDKDAECGIFIVILNFVVLTFVASKKKTPAQNRHCHLAEWRHSQLMPQTRDKESSQDVGAKAGVSANRKTAGGRGREETRQWGRSLRFSSSSCLSVWACGRAVRATDWAGWRKREETEQSLSLFQRKKEKLLCGFDQECFFRTERMILFKYGVCEDWDYLNREY